MKDAKLFPIEVDLSRNAFQYESVNQQFQVWIQINGAPIFEPGCDSKERQSDGQIVLSV